MNIAYNILQKRVFLEPSKIRLCINPEWLNVRKKLALKNDYEDVLLFDYNIVSNNVYLFKNSLVASIYNKDTFTEYLFYTPNSGTVSKTNDALFKNINNIFNCNYYYSDMLEKLWIAELNIDNGLDQSNKWFSGYY